MRKLERLPVKIKIGGKEYDLKYDEEVKIAEETINENLADQPSYFAWYAVLQKMAEDVVTDVKKELAKARLDLEMTEAVLDTQLRKELPKKVDKVTETVIMSHMKVHKDWVEVRTAVDDATHALNKANNDVGVLRAIKDGFLQRMNSMISLASNMRIQADPEIFIRKEQYKKQEESKV